MADDKKTVLYVVDEALTFDWPVVVPVPANGKYVQAEFTATFANLVGDALDALTKRDDSGVPVHTDLEIANQVLVGYSGLKKANGENLDFSEEAKARLLANQRVRMAVVGTYLAAARGMAAEKN